MSHKDNKWNWENWERKLQTKQTCFFEWMLLFLKIVECDSGTYGENCSYQCGECINDMICDHVNGKCSDGCKTGWQTTDTCHECMYMNWITYLYVLWISMFCSHVIMLSNRQSLLGNENELRLENQLQCCNQTRFTLNILEFLDYKIIPVAS